MVVSIMPCTAKKAEITRPEHYTDGEQNVDYVLTTTEITRMLQEAGIDYESAEAQFVPTMRTPVDLEGAQKALRLIDALEDSDDVQAVYSNLDIPDEVAAQLGEDE